MTEADVVRMTHEVFRDSFEIPEEKLQPGANLFTDLGLDSLDTVDLVVALQKKFGVRIRDDERVRQIRTLGDVHRFILSVKQAAESAGGG